MSTLPKELPIPQQFNFSQEFRLVAVCSWLPVTNHLVVQEQMVGTLCRLNLDWGKVVTLVQRHGVVGQFCAVMGKRGWSNVPCETREQLKILRSNQAVRGLGQVVELARLGSLFRDSGIPLMPLKGVALSQQLYNDPCIRSSVDLDILVPFDMVENAEELLVQLGYSHTLGFHGMSERQKHHIITTCPHHVYINESIRSHIELHWRSYLWSDDQTAEIWRSSVASPWLDCDLKQLSLEDNFLFLADHGARHGWLCLKWLSDTAMLAENFSENIWHSLYRKAAMFDLQRVVCHTALLLEWFYGIELPQTIQEACSSSRVARKFSNQTASQLLISQEVSYKYDNKFAAVRQAFRIKQLKPSTTSYDLLRCIMINHAEFAELPLPDLFFWLYIPLRPWFWLRRHYLKTHPRLP